ncbi:hypothetical protein A6V25_10595 [Nostoc sp. ATCC 53789]|nr:hypothetical protein A6V25_10595 [Nostoc sp. ATCC 53789]
MDKKEVIGNRKEWFLSCTEFFQKSNMSPIAQYGSVKAKTLCQSQFFLRTTETQRSQCVGRVPRLKATGAALRE